MPPDLLDREGSLGGGWAAARDASAAALGAAAADVVGRRRDAASDGAGDRSFRLGDDVVHAAFGEGVVTGVEPGGIVVVRFAGDGSERKLMAELRADHEALVSREPVARRRLSLGSDA